MSLQSTSRSVLAQLTADVELLREGYASNLRLLGGSTSDLPSEVRPDPSCVDLSDPLSPERIEREKARVNLLSIQMPLYSPLWPKSMADASPGQKVADAFRQALARVMEDIRDWCVLTGHEPQMKLVPLVYYRGGSADSSPMHGDEILDALNKAVRVLASLENPGKLRTTDLGQRLRKARKAAGETQEAVAAKLGCDVSTVSRIERGLQEPETYREQLEQYIAGSE